MTPTDSLEVFIIAGEPRAIVALTRPNAKDDAPPEALIGTVALAEGLPQWNTVVLREEFRAFYLDYMRGRQAARPAILDEAKVAPGSYVYVIDGRVKNPRGDVPFHEIIGWYTSDHRGRAVATSFEYNGDHQLITDAGGSSLLSDPRLRALVYPALRKA